MRITSLILICFFLFSTSNATAREPVSLRTVTYNTWMIPFLRKDAKERANIIGHGLGSGGYELVFLQEMFSKRFRKIVKRRYRDSSNNLFGGLFNFRLPAIINSGLMTFTGYEVVDFAFKRYHACGGFQCLSSKGIQFSRIKLGEGLFIDVYNTHLQPFEDGNKIRAKQMDEIRSFMLEHSNQGNPVILAGDFNIISEASEYGVLMDKFYDFKDAWAQTRPYEPGYSWNPGENRYAKPDRGTQFENQRVDYLLLRDGQDWAWEIKDIKLDFTRPWEYKGRSYFGSDHFAVGADLRLIPAQ